MKNKFMDNLIFPKIQSSIIVCFALIIVLLYYNLLFAIIGMVAILCVIFYEVNAANKKKKDLAEYIENLTNNMDMTVKKTIVTNPLPICIIEKSGIITWYNKNFSELFSEADLINSSIEELVPTVKMETLYQDNEKNAPLIVSINDRMYKLVYSDVSKEQEEDNMVVVYWLDVTGFEELKEVYRDEKPCFVYINVDNYEELLSKSSEERRVIITSQIEVKIRQFGQKNFAAMIKYDDDKYVMVTDNKQLEKLEETKFSILDEIREIETEADFPISLSIGVGVGGKNLMQNDESAEAALDLALGRGGDQAVVKKLTKITYYGGRMQTVEKRNKGRSRIMSHAIKQLIDQSSSVMIMGHKNPDMDAFGAAVGIYAMVQEAGKPVGIVLDYVGESLQSLYDYAMKAKGYTIFNCETALSVVDKETLLVVVDTHSAEYTECPELLTKVERIVLIDHHRRMEKMIENATLAYMEPYASSACELVTEILQYTGEKTIIGKVDAEALLAGITLDTKHFSTRCGVRTFEAASYLRRVGTDTANVRQFFQVEQRLFKKKAKAVVDAEMVGGNVAVSKCEEPDKDIGLITALAADELLDIKGTKAAFVCGTHNTGKTIISARSLGEINVQVIMEKMGGGGHLNMAGTQIETPLTEAVEEVKSIVAALVQEEEARKE